MGYRTNFSGHLNLTPPLTRTQRGIMRAWFDGVGVPEECPTRYDLDLIVSPDGDKLETHDELERSGAVTEWLDYFLETLFPKWGVKAEGAFMWEGEDFGDHGFLCVRDGSVHERTDYGNPGAAQCVPTEPGSVYVFRTAYGYGPLCTPNACGETFETIEAAKHALFTRGLTTVCEKEGWVLAKVDIEPADFLPELADYQPTYVIDDSEDQTNIANGTQVFFSYNTSIGSDDFEGFYCIGGELPDSLEGPLYGEFTKVEADSEGKILSATLALYRRAEDKDEPDEEDQRTYGIELNSHDDVVECLDYIAAWDWNH